MDYREDGEPREDQPEKKALATKKEYYKARLVINTRELYKTSQLVSRLTGLSISANKAIVGENAFSHGSEAHAHGTLTQPLLNKPFPPKIVGRESQFYLSKQIEKPLVEDLLTLAGIRVSSEQIHEIVRRIRRMQEKLDKGEVQMIFYQIKKLTREMKKGLTEEDFWKIVQKVTGQKPKLSHIS